MNAHHNRNTTQPWASRTTPRWIALGLIILAHTTILAGCGSGSSSSRQLTSFEHGYADGFARDGEYFLGYDDSWFTIGFAPILYQGGDIPFIDDFSYDAGFFDGLFDAYNDGYFVAYRYALIIGFSEGYDNAYWPDYLDFLAADVHTEYLNGGFSDGYNDGFSEGRVFGAFDFEVFLPFDWLDAFLDWESGTDLFFEEVGVGTGVFGPVTYYEWALDPHFLRKPERGAGLMRAEAPSLRSVSREEPRDVIERLLGDSQTAELDVTPTDTPRTSRDLRISESWLDRIDAATSFSRSGDPASARPADKRAARMR